MQDDHNLSLYLQAIVELRQLPYQRDEDDEGDGPLVLEHGQLLPHEDLHGVRQVVHSLLGRVQVQDLE